MPSSITLPVLATPSILRLRARAGQLQSELQTLQDLPIDEQSDTEQLARQLEEALRQFWNTSDANRLPRYKTWGQQHGQALDDEITLKIDDGSLVAAYRHYLPAVSGRTGQDLNVHTLHLRREDQPAVEIHGALLFSRGDGPCLMHLPGFGLEGFATLDELRATLAYWLNEDALRGLLLRNTVLDYQNAIEQTLTDPDLGREQFTARHVLLLPLADEPFTYAIKRQIIKQRQDVAYACQQHTLRAQDPARWRQGIQAALAMDNLVGPAAMLRLREVAQQQRRHNLKHPQWMRNATPADLKTWLDAFTAYDQARLALDSLMQGCTSASRFVATRLAARLQDDLGYDLDPDQVMVSTSRRTPLGDESYELTRSLSDLALYGLHDTDLDEGSTFQTSSRFSQAGQALDKTYPLLTAQWLVTAIRQLDLRVTFAQAQRRLYAEPEVSQAMADVIRRQILALAHDALYQAHIRPADLIFTGALTGQPEPSNVRVSRLLLGGQVINGLLLFGLPRSGDDQRLVLVACNVPRQQQVMAFDNERQLLHELVSWSASAPLRQYLLEQVIPQQRAELDRQLLALKEKPQPAPDWLRVVRLAGADAAVQDMVKTHIAIRIGEQPLHTPHWYSNASLTQRGELQALTDAIEHLTDAYQQQPHTQMPDFERFVHDLASRKINTLLGLADKTVDPDRIIITSPRETLSYTQMLRDGYDDSIGFLNASADTQATFSGPPGIDLSLLTPEKVSGSVRGAWPSDAWIALLRTTLLDPQSEGYAWRRRISLQLTQLRMRSAALTSLLKQQISDAQYAWLKASIERMQHSDPFSRKRYAIYPLQFLLDNPFIASAAPVLGEVLNIGSQIVPGGTPVSMLETAQGCYLLCPPDSRDPDRALLYTPQAPDGLQWRPLSGFVATLQHAGMSDYYKDRCPKALNRLMAFWFADQKKRSDAQPPALPEKPYEDLHDVCFNRVLLRKIRDVENITTGRGDMISKVVWNSLELVAVALTLPFPPASFTVGALLAMRDNAKALQAFSEGDDTAAGMHILGAWLNALGAAGDASVGLKGFGLVLRHLADKGGHNPAMAAVKLAQGKPSRYLKPVEIDGQPFWAANSNLNGQVPLFRSAPHDPQKLLPTGQFGEPQVSGNLRPLALDRQASQTSTAGQPNPDYIVQRSLDNTTPIASGHGQGVTRLEGHHYIRIDGLVYEVQYDARQGFWQIIDPANPFAFFGKQPVYLTDSGTWRLIEPARLRGGTGGKFRLLDSEPATPSTSSARPSSTQDFELPASSRREAMTYADLDAHLVEDVGLGLPPEFFNPLLKQGREVYGLARKNLQKHASEFFQQPALAAKADLPQLPEEVSTDGLIKAVFSHNNAMVVSEAPKSVASKRFLIENMPRLAEQNVEIIYIEHLFTDVHPIKLSKYQKLGGKTNSGSVELKTHFDQLNRGALQNGSRHKHDYYHLVKTAHRHGIEVKPLSSTVSYDFIASSAPVVAEDAMAMHKMSVFFGYRVIADDIAQVPGRRWVALLEQTRANTHQQVPGISELHGATSVRVRDVASDQPVRISRDLPSAQATQPLSHADFRLEMPNPQIKPANQTRVLATATLPEGPDNLDHALSLMLARRKRASAPGEPLPLHRQLAEQPGPHGFILDDHGQWQRAPALEWPTSQESTALQRSLADPLYDMPAEHLAAMHELAYFERRGLNTLYTLENEANEPARRLFIEQRARLQRDARQLASQTLPQRAPLPAIDAQASHTQLIDTLYEHSSGIVIGEYHSSIASKQFIIDNLPHLAKREVKTLYLEHLQADMYQPDLDLFSEKGLMSKRLLHFLRHSDEGFFTDPAGVYNFEQLVIKAHEHGIEVRALDCMASYHVRHMPGGTRHDRMFMMNHYASRVIRRHQQVVGSHRWIALVGESHANTFDNTVPGLAQTEQAFSVRIYDTALDEPFGPALDPGRTAGDPLGRDKIFTRNDYALGIPTSYGPVSLGDDLASALPAELRLRAPGMFLVEGADTPQLTIVHRSRHEGIVRTPVQRTGSGKLYIDRERWKGIHLRRFDNLSALLQALRQLNMTLVS